MLHGVRNTEVMHGGACGLCTAEATGGGVRCIGIACVVVLVTIVDSMNVVNASSSRDGTSFSNSSAISLCYFWTSRGRFCFSV